MDTPSTIAVPVELSGDELAAIERRAALEQRDPAALLRDGASLYLRLSAHDGAGQIVAAALEEYAARLEQEAAQPERRTVAPSARSRAALARSVRSEFAQRLTH